ncbi:MAG: gluconate 2-dehydrogenase subunit 3 family protein [Vicinamibacterales bacterium]|jgi:hypothetical protein|nr:hypothetical protein [Acidobacteriota bacterium]MDP7295635.1 gluconate 2-dehydrogenase subunit 3 family protein [Vicinamibacterales bacterium]MDP7473297.1 gluconate 2-dehydrogenase subunit 3 family protein [Vicinamibacterales bacterium]MDP7673136.1 gluconate 2-dehydrogenase subunit 3 family protein [Vicinamibacterales bacterium]HJO37312.1 gluconate 2-dehydrogenase subunit 3 family protein [Vicinamibacterales bacterium]|tara:strand:+ start:1057 stop:1656 length:600 start_codon:yes stop_codon:yes gene_type:complete
MPSDQSVSRREALQILAAAAALPLLDPGRLHHPSVQVPVGEAWQPQFLAPDDIETVAAVAERIIPRTETPGARDAAVHEYIDFALDRGEAEARESFATLVRWFERHVREAHRAAFADLQQDRQDEILTALSDPATAAAPEGHAFFVLMKELTIEGYYRSEAGMFEELGFAGNTFLTEFAGCAHPEHLAWRPARPDPGAE